MDNLLEETHPDHAVVEDRRVSVFVCLCLPNIFILYFVCTYVCNCLSVKYLYPNCVHFTALWEGLTTPLIHHFHY